MHVGALLLGLILAADPPPAKPLQLTLEAVTVEPSSPTAETLCRLRVTVKNAGQDFASALELAVRVNGQELPAYKNRLFYDPVPPGTAKEVRLFNFWTTESGRPAPADGKLKVEVALKEAQWVEVKSEGGAEVWKPVGPVEGLPLAVSISLELKGETGAARPSEKP